MRSRLCEGAATIDQIAFEDGLEAGEEACERSPALLAVALGALVLAVLPAAVAITILLGTTVPLEFGAGAVVAILGGVKLAAAASGLVAAARDPRPPALAPVFHS